MRVERISNADGVNDAFEDRSQPKNTMDELSSTRRLLVEIIFRIHDGIAPPFTHFEVTEAAMRIRRHQRPLVDRFAGHLNRLWFTALASTYPAVALGAAVVAMLLVPNAEAQKKGAPAPRAAAPAVHSSMSTATHGATNGAAGQPGSGKLASAASLGSASKLLGGGKLGTASKLLGGGKLGSASKLLGGGKLTGAGKLGGTTGAGLEHQAVGGHLPTTPHTDVPHPAEIHTVGGGTRIARPDGGSEFHGAHGEQAQFDHAGRVREIRTGDMHIQHGPGGMRRVEMTRADHSHLVMEGHGRGYVQRPFTYGGHTYYHRDYYVNGVRYAGFYRPYYYHGVYLTGYVPARYYAPVFYGWAYAPWSAPVVYPWGWGAAPWYGYYGPYFAPYPAYVSASLWLTDYLISRSLQEAYQRGVAAGAPGYAIEHDAPMRSFGGAHLVYASYSPSGAGSVVSSGPTVLTPQIKQLVADEVQADLAAEKGQAARHGADSPGSTNGLAQLLSDGKPHVFVVSTDISAASAESDCGLTEGDVLQSGPAASAADATAIDVTVLAGKKKDCANGSHVSVSLEDLQEMQNHLMATVDQGLGELSAHAGQSGLPALPAGAQQTADAPYVSAAPPTDQNVDQELAQGEQEANQAEQAVMSQAASSEPAVSSGPIGGVATAGDAPVLIALGQTPAQVTASKGAPSQIVNLGRKQVYVYPDMKITFVGNKVSDVK